MISSPCSFLRAHSGPMSPGPQSDGHESPRICMDSILDLYGCMLFLHDLHRILQYVTDFIWIWVDLYRLRLVVLSIQVFIFSVVYNIYIYICIYIYPVVTWFLQSGT